MQTKLQFYIKYTYYNLQRIYQSRVHIVNELKQRQLEISYRTQQTIINSAINKWCNQLKACVGEGWTWTSTV